MRRQLVNTVVLENAKAQSAERISVLTIFCHAETSRRPAVRTDSISQGIMLVNHSTNLPGNHAPAWQIRMRSRVTVLYLPFPHPERTWQTLSSSISRRTSPIAHGPASSPPPLSWFARWLDHRRPRSTNISSNEGVVCITKQQPAKASPFSKELLNRQQTH